MDSNKIETLLDKYFDGTTTLTEEDELMAYFAQDEAKIPVKLRQYRPQFQFFTQARTEQKLDAQFDKNLEKMIAIKEDLAPNLEVAKSDLNDEVAEKGHQTQQTKTVQIRRSSLYWIGGIAASLVLMVASFYMGRMSVDNTVAGPGGTPDQNTIQEMVQKEVQKIQAKLNEPSASERLQAVKATTKTFKDQNDQVIEALIKTLNNDENQNVRLAAANALFVYKDNPRVRDALIVSISHQTDPVLKIAMVNMLLALKDKRAKEPIERILKNDTEIPKAVRETIQDNLKAL
ncbi:hypothetical protein BKI52_09460 [marine bacterium AO1-C]|nr:hypothetical protein BKI52_09460 [marine bacterium AO1-C]